MPAVHPAAAMSFAISARSCESLTQTLVYGSEHPFGGRGLVSTWEPPKLELYEIEPAPS